MALKEYQRKRHFDDTPEPSGKGKKHVGAALSFVIQKHAASHLHYDFRLECDGVLKSWAFPKGPSLDTQIKRLAMQVEDHPLDYQTFEGIIPEGNYGAGNVMVWDNGTYSVDPAATRSENEQLVIEGIEAGKLTFQLNGTKLQGEFALVKTHQNDKSWLLIKHKDEYVQSEDILSEDTSVLSGRSMTEIAEEKAGKSKPKGKPMEKNIKDNDPFPSEIHPMLATLVDKPFSKSGWLFELKWDGYRAIAETNGKTVQLYSRNQKPFEAMYPDIVKGLKALHLDQVILDGEIVVLDADGKPSFQRLQDYQLKPTGILVYYVFDILFLNGYDTQALPLIERKRLLEGILPPSEVIRYCDHVEEAGEAFYQAAVEQDMEGIMAKEAASPYLCGKRSAAWLKIKHLKQQEAIICGFTALKGSRTGFGSLILGVYQEDQLQFIGHTGSGFNEESIRFLQNEMKPYITSQCPFPKKPIVNNTPTWLEPVLVCEVEFTEWTGDSHLRHPIYLGLRMDKSATDVVMEVAKNTSQQIRKAKLLEQPEKNNPADHTKPHDSKRFSKEAPQHTPGKQIQTNDHTLTISHPQKIFWPQSGYTKMDLVHYYQAVAPSILPFLKNRPFVLNRFPNGIEGEHFYQKDQASELPTWVETTDIYSESNGKDLRYLLCQNEETLLYLVNLGCIEMHPWNSRVENIDKPDWLIIDLDPEDIEFTQVIEAAKITHDVLEHLGIPSYCKTSGATGLHVFVPMGGVYDYETVKNFAHVLAAMVNKELPKTTSLERSPSKRPKKVYLDYLQNRLAQTLASPFSVRPMPEATISMPLQWDEVKKGLHPQQFTMKNSLEHIPEAAKWWRPVLEKGIHLEKILKILGK